MAVDQKVGIFTTRMRSEFLRAFKATAEPAPYERYTQVIPSDARIEHYTWMSPSPGLALYQGHRRYGKVEPIRYSVSNKEFDAAFSVLLRDVEDDQTGGYDLKPKELADRARLFPGRWVLKQLALGTTNLCFDGTAFFANSHTIGSGDNLLTQTATGNSDGLTYKMVALHHGGALKPLIWQNRKPPKFRTNAGTPQSDEAKEIRYWIDMEGEGAYGYWWDAIHLTFTNLPNVADIHTALGSITTAFRGFTLPKSLTSEDGEYIHEQTQFSTENLTLVVAPAIERVVYQALNAEWIPVTIGATTVSNTNLYRGYAEVVATNFLA